MTDEEKEVIKYFENNKEYSFTCEVPKKELNEALGIEETDFETEVIKINTLLNLIYKQQKEIEQFYKEININTEIHKRDIRIKDLEETINCLHETGKEYISKDKIREKIKELEQIQNTALTETTIEIMNYKIDILKQLLEE